MTSPLHQPTGYDNHRILLVDGSRQTHDALRKILCVRSQNPTSTPHQARTLDPTALDASDSICFELDSAYQGRDALALTSEARKENRPYAVVFIDPQTTPNTNGLHTLSQLWQIDSQLMIVLMAPGSYRAWEYDLASIAHAGQLLILEKPFQLLTAQQIALNLTRQWNRSQKARHTVAQLTHRAQKQKKALERQSELRKKCQQERDTLRQDLKKTDLSPSQASHTGDLSLSINTITANLHRLKEQLEHLPTPATVLTEMQALLDEAQAEVETVGKIAAKMGESTEHPCIKLNTINLNQLLENALDQLANPLTNIEVQQAWGDIPDIQADEQRLFEACMTLLQQAIGAVQEQSSPRIRINTGADSCLWLEISDNGSGIDAKALSQLFAPLFAARQACTRNHLSLQPVKQLVAEMGGSIHPHSEPGKGTVIRLEWPIK